MPLSKPTALRSSTPLVAVSIIAISELLCTTLWFSVNGVKESLSIFWGVESKEIGLLTSAVQFGFICGTLLISIRGLADRYKPSIIFTVSAILGAFLNLLFPLSNGFFPIALAIRFFVGITLAGIYPLGMKLIVSWSPGAAGFGLSLLVSMLTIGTALPHEMSAFATALPWQFIIYLSSILALFGGIAVYILGDGPYFNAASTTRHRIINSTRPVIFTIFRIPKFRAAALGYFGHMWELYAFWTIVPLLVSSAVWPTSYGLSSQSHLSFYIIAIGALGCILGGYLSRYFGSASIARIALALSALCCLAYVLGLHNSGGWLLLVFFSIWSMSAIADSPHFSALAASAAPIEYIGSALAIQTSIGYALTILSIMLASTLYAGYSYNVVWILLPGPILGLVGFQRYFRN